MKRPALAQIGWWLVSVASGMLEVEERDAVRGDFAESGETCGRALAGLPGLVIRRQAGLWRHWQPWLAVIGLAGITGLLLSSVVGLFDVAVSARLRGSSLLWNDPGESLFSSTFDPFAGAAFHIGKLTPAEDLVYVACIALALLLISWTSGFLLGSLSGRTIWITGWLFYLMVLNSQPILSGRVRWGSPQAPPFVWFVMDRFVPSGIGTLLLFMIPVCLGANYGLQRRTLGATRTLALAGGITILISIWSASWPQTILWQLLLLSWPVAYLMVSAIRSGATNNLADRN